MARKALTLTIVIPVFNDEDHLKKCLNSIAAQVVKPDEVIVVDNNCTDGSMKVAQSFPFVKIIREKRQGVVFARDAGFDAATSDIIGRIDSDSVLPEDWVQYVLKFYAETENQNFAITGGCYFYNVRTPAFASWWQDQVAFRYNRLLMGHYILFGSNMAVTREQWQASRELVCDDTDVHEDLDLAIHLHRLGYEISYDQSFRVGVVMRRVRSHRDELWDNIMWWPKTLRRHGKKTWVFGWLGAVLFYALSPIVPVSEWLAEAFGRERLPD